VCGSEGVSVCVVSPPVCGLCHGFIYSVARCVTGQSHNSKSCDTQGVIIGVKSVYIFSLDIPP